jgi:hypothetical protein
MHFELGEYGGNLLSKEYQNTAQTLRRVARNITDQAIADRLEVLAKDYEWRAERASLTDNALARSAARGESETSTPMNAGSVTR